MLSYTFIIDNNSCHDIINMTKIVVIMTNIIIIIERRIMILRNNVKLYRVKLGINQQQLGTLVQVSRQTISLIERGDYNPSISLALKLAKVFECRVEDIFYLEDREDEKD